MNMPDRPTMIFRETNYTYIDADEAAAYMDALEAKVAALEAQNEQLEGVFRAHKYEGTLLNKLLQLEDDLSKAKRQIAQAYNDGVEAAAEWHRSEGRALNGWTSILSRQGRHDAAQRDERRADQHFRDANEIDALKRPVVEAQKEQE